MLTFVEKLKIPLLSG